MNHKHKVPSRKHAARAIAKHASHPAAKHTAHAVMTRSDTAGQARPFESLGTVIEDMLAFPVTEAVLVDMPPVDIRETHKTIEVSVPLAGVDKKDIHLDLTEDALAISCERGEEKNQRGDDGYRFREQSYDRFYMSFMLPAAVKTGDAKAVYKHGVLTVTLHKQNPDRNRQLRVE